MGTRPERVSWEGTVIQKTASRRWLVSCGTRLLNLAGGIGFDPCDSNETALRKRVGVVLFAGTLPLTVAWSAIYFIADAPLAASVPALYSILTPINTAIFARTHNFEIYRFTQLLLILILPWFVLMSLGGFQQSSVVILWAALSPLGSLLLDDLRRTRFWIAGFATLLTVSAILDPYLPHADLPQTFVTWFFVLNIGTVIAIAFGLLYYFVDRRNFFQQRAELLLLNILPKEISEALKASPRTIADQYTAASVLFADVVGFTPMASTMTPLQLVDLLNEVFQCFDNLVEKYDLEKIKTIGDCYMVASGVPRSRSDHAVALVELAIDMRAAVADRRFGDRQLSFRIGINSGPVVAGVIGRKKFIYDLWGEAVNLASRMESHGRSGCIQITRNTHELIEDAFVCEALGSIDVKGAGPIEVWHVMGRNSARAELTSPRD
jgi:adenylate cyclase